MYKPLIKENLKNLDALRGIAACYVLIHHCRWLLWEGFETGYSKHPETYNWFNKIFVYLMSAFKFGNEAVLFFFVLSGFVIHYSVSRRIQKEGKFSITEYLVKRIRRIYPPLLIALLVAWLLDTAGMKLGYPVYFSQTAYPSINENIHPHLDLTTLLGNLFFVQKIYTPVWGTDGALWSLMYEWWFYMLYVPLLFLFRKNKYITTAGVFLLWILSLLYGNYMPLLAHKVLNLFIIWYAGMLLADVLIEKTFDIRAGLVFLFAVAFSGAALAFSVIGKEVILTALITAFLYFVLTTRIFNALLHLEKLGAFSYTLYAVHMPLICLISGWLMHRNQGRLPAHFGYAFAGTLLALALGWILHLAGEKPFTKK